MKRIIMFGMLAMSAAACWAQEPNPGKTREQNAPGGSSMRHGRMFGMSFNEEVFPPEMIMQNQQALGLTDEQKRTILEAMKAFSAQFTELQWKQSAEQETMASLLKQEQIDEARALAQLDNLLKIENEIKKISLANMIKVRNLLTAEQKTKMKFIRQSMMRQMEERRGGSNPPPPPKNPEDK
ncbi:MAG TPA: hypothetical protein DET40_10160 [Lentisphaeria bacterium]|nr:MAG: hypothetical protein A2X45_10120 [Lentisphaerae bacterium GWF2_50_93]HCE43899.1 hypothetical protein [Lentisphaeria bacterium]